MATAVGFFATRAAKAQSLDGQHAFNWDLVSGPLQQELLACDKMSRSTRHLPCEKTQLRGCLLCAAKACAEWGPRPQLVWGPLPASGASSALGEGMLRELL